MSNELEAFVENDVEETVETTADSQDTPEVEVQAESVDEQDTSQGETGEPPSPQQETMIPLAAKQAEKERRKQAERERDDLRLELARREGFQQAQVKTAPKEVPDPYTDPENYAKYQNEQLYSRIQQESDAQLRARLLSAEEVARVELDDYDKYAEHFAKQVAPNNPQVIEMMKASPDPAKFAYYKGKQHLQETEISNQIQQAGGLEAYTKMIAEKARIEALSETKADPASRIPPDMSSVRNAGGEPANGDIADGTDGLNQLLNR